MGDKANRLIIDALSRAALEPRGCALFASKNEPGLFPATATARQVAERCKSDELLQVVRSENKGKMSREICVLTEKGRNHLLREASPREVLEDFVRLLEKRQTEVDSLREAAQDMFQSLEQMRATVTELMPRVLDSPTPVNGSPSSGGHLNGRPTTLMTPLASIASDALIAEVKAKLAEWHATAGASEDCPLPELYRRLEAAGQPTIGQFHDCLRQLHDDRMIYLHPWTGPLYALPEPAFALLVGHEIGYYASIR